MKNLLINCPIVSLIEPPLNIFFRFFCFVAEDLYNDGVIGGDGFVCRTLSDLCICDAPFPGGLVDHRQPTENQYVSYHETHM